MGGYYLLFWALQAKSDKELTARLDDEDYRTEETFEVKIPLTLPYPIHAESFQRADGKFEHKGEFFKLVKQRLANDTLFVVLIKNQETKKLSAEFNKFTSQSHHQAGSNEKSTFSVLKLLADFENEKFSGLYCTQGWCIEYPFQPMTNLYVSPAGSTPTDPPDFLS